MSLSVSPAAASPSFVSSTGVSVKLQDDHPVNKRIRIDF
jgi:hypothetical protein